MAIAVADVCFAAMAIALGASRARELAHRIAGGNGIFLDGSAHEFVGAAGVLAIAEQGGAVAIVDRRGFCRRDLSSASAGFWVAVADETGVVVVSGIGVGECIAFAIKCGALLNFHISMSSPENTGGNGLVGEFGGNPSYKNRFGQ